MRVFAKETAVSENLMPADEANSIGENSGNDEEASSMDRQAVTAQLQSLDAGLLGDGGAMRKVLILPQNNIDEESMAKLETSLQGGTVVELEGLGSAMLLIDGERLDIVDLIDGFGIRPPKETTSRAITLSHRH